VDSTRAVSNGGVVPEDVEVKAETMRRSLSGDGAGLLGGVDYDEVLGEAERLMGEIETKAHVAQGDPAVIGEFLYLEGHE
jgi:hypothetical protein